MKTDMSSDEFRKADSRKGTPAQKAWRTQQNQDGNLRDLLERRKLTREQRFARSLRMPLVAMVQTLEVRAPAYRDLTGGDEYAQAAAILAVAVEKLTEVAG